jgi:large subunit ribosomal protein L9
MEVRGFNLDRRKIQLDEPLKTLGDFDVQIKLHRDVAAPIKVSIKPDTE